MRERLRSIFSEQGLLASHLPQFKFRSDQLDMAFMVAEALETPSSVALLEAATGIGKTFAYAIPAMLSGKKTIISTANLYLQDQLMGKDLDFLQSMLQSQISCVALKGRKNYLCLDRLKFFNDNPDMLGQDQALTELLAWSKHTQRGEFSELKTSNYQDQSSRFTVTYEECKGRYCPDFTDCFIYKQREIALDSDCVVVNHDMLLQDLVMRSRGPQQQLLPNASLIIIDEAHQFYEKLTHALSFEYSFSRSERMLRELKKISKDSHTMQQACDIALHANHDCLSKIHTSKEGVLKFDSIRNSSSAIDAIGYLLSKLDRVCDEITVLSTQQVVFEGTLQLFQRLIDALGIIASQDEMFIRYIKTTQMTKSLIATPLDVSYRYQSLLTKHFNQTSFVYTSATLSVGGSFSTFAYQLGLQNTLEATYPSPFNLKQKSLIYFAEDLPDPQSQRQEFLDQYTKVVFELVYYNQGRSLLLFSSNDNLNEVYRRFLELHQKKEQPLTLLKQNTAPARQLVKSFITEPRAVLFGMKQFMEGLDITGDSLCLVAIDKIPFLPPDDPLTEGRAKRLVEEGKDSFRELFYAEAILALKQAIGRLIRCETDRGIVIFGDSRVASKSYGRKIKEEFSEHKQTNDKATAIKFIEKMIQGDRVKKRKKP
ncbi:MAG: ATP-dependent DNA helicase [Methylacidiphilales bacterium]|nr:ATP-dependent DNA helicase [Candidatus Methylacidiphilales bacterium]